MTFSTKQTEIDIFIELVQCVSDCLMGKEQPLR